MKIIKNFVEKIVSEVLLKLKIIPVLNLVHYFEKDKINLFYVKTGRMPRGKAEEWCLKVEESIKKNNSEYKFLIIPYSTDDISSIIKPIYQLEEDKYNIIYIPVGRMPKGKAEEYIKKYIIKLNTLKEDKKYKTLFLALDAD